MKKLIIVFLCLFYFFSVNAEEYNKISLGDVVLYENGQKTIHSVDGVTFDADAMLLTINSNFRQTSDTFGLQIENIKEMVIDVKGSPKISITNVNSSLYISESKVKIKSSDNSKINFSSTGNYGIILTGSSKLAIEDVIVDTDNIFLSSLSILEKKASATLNASSIKVNGVDVSFSSLKGDFTLKDGVYQIGTPKYKVNKEIKKNNTIKSLPVLFGMSIVGIIFIISCIVVIVKHPASNAKLLPE